MKHTVCTTNNQNTRKAGKAGAFAHPAGWILAALLAVCFVFAPLGGASADVPHPTRPPVPGFAAIMEYKEAGKTPAEDKTTEVENPVKQENDSPDLEDGKNAIQKAIDAAIETIESNDKIRDITIQVESGQYDGDIQIVKPNGAADGIGGDGDGGQA